MVIRRRAKKVSDSPCYACHIGRLHIYIVHPDLIFGGIRYICAASPILRPCAVLANQKVAGRTVFAVPCALNACVHTKVSAEVHLSGSFWYIYSHHGTGSRLNAVLYPYALVIIG